MGFVKWIWPAVGTYLGLQFLYLSVVSLGAVAGWCAPPKLDTSWMFLIAASATLFIFDDVFQAVIAIRKDAKEGVG